MELLSSENKRSRFRLDPRTKLLMIIIIAIFTMGGVGSDIPCLKTYTVLFSFVPILLLVTDKSYIKAAVYGALYIGLYFFGIYGADKMHGGLQILFAIMCMAMLRFMPGLIMGAYTLSSTTVSEFIAALQRAHIPVVITIPLSVMFRFFPTVLEEFSSINTAMKMRDIRLGGKNSLKIVEYRLIPLLVCSANIGSELSAAALTRGLSTKHGRTNLCEVGFHVQDICLMALSVIPVVLLIAGKAGVI